MLAALRASVSFACHTGSHQSGIQQRLLQAVPVCWASAAVTRQSASATPLPPAAPALFARTMSTMSSSSAESEVLSELQGKAAVATLNRPRALNALNTNMVESMFDLYQRWDADPGVACILLKGAGGKAFCAGGDVKTVVQLGQARKTDEALRFFYSEYRLNYLINKLSKPHVALIDGITMGGGVGVSVHGTFRVATERTMFSMPECAIGLYPDVGGSYFLPRLHGGLGLYLALTGARLNGVDVRHADIATHYIPSKLLPEVERAIVDLGPAASDAGVLGGLLRSFEQREPLPEGQLASIWADINFCFGGKRSVEEVYAECERSGGQWGIDTIAQMSKGSPMSQKVSFEQLRRGAALDLGECLKMENRMVYRCVTNVGSDFYTGVTAMLITRSGNPAWFPASLKDIRQHDVEEFFMPLPNERELQLPPVPGSGLQCRL